jgi:hypothetical protein
VLAVLLAGCEDPYQREHAQARSAPKAHVRGDVERPGPRAPAVAAVPEAHASGARAAARAFADAWVNWDWRTLPTQQDALARLATGQLADELRANATRSAADASLARDRPSSRGRVIALDLHVTRGEAAAVVVTREQTYTAGHADLGGRHHHVYRALLARVGGGWGISAWTPLP